MIDARRGVLYPARLPRLHRLQPPADAAELVAWFWIPEWDVDPGRTSRQHVVAYPALNLVVEEDGVQLVGATTTASFRDLTGRGWAVGALLRPAAVAALCDDPSALRDDEVAVDAPDLRRAVVRAMTADTRALTAGTSTATDRQHARRAQAVAAVSRWLVGRVGEVTPVARQANTMSDLLMSDAAILRSEEAAARLAVSTRTLQRLAHRYVGVPPAAMIRRRRLQEAAQRMRDDPDAELSAIAAELGYADHAHLTNDFRAVLGIAPRAYRAGVSPGRG